MRLAQIIIAAAVITATSPVFAESDNAQRCSASYRAEVEELMDDYIGVYNNHDMTALSTVYTGDAVEVSPLGAMTIPEMATLMDGFIAAFPDLHYTVKSLVIDGSRVVLEYTYTGTHTFDLWGIPATGIVVHGRGLEIHDIENGRIAHTENYSDVFGLYVQLGLL